VQQQDEHRVGSPHTEQRLAEGDEWSIKRVKKVDYFAMRGIPKCAKEVREKLGQDNAHPPEQTNKADPNERTNRKCQLMFVVDCNTHLKSLPNCFANKLANLNKMREVKLKNFPLDSFCKWHQHLAQWAYHGLLLPSLLAVEKGMGGYSPKPKLTSIQLILSVEQPGLLKKIEEKWSWKYCTEESFRGSPFPWSNWKLPFINWTNLMESQFASLAWLLSWCLGTSEEERKDVPTQFVYIYYMLVQYISIFDAIQLLSAIGKVEGLNPFQSKMRPTSIFNNIFQFFSLSKNLPNFWRERNTSKFLKFLFEFLNCFQPCS
jgi:hypothetical protein